MQLPRDSYHVYSPARSWLASFSNIDDAVTYCDNKVEAGHIRRLATNRSRRKSLMPISLDYIVIHNLKVIYPTTGGTVPSTDSILSVPTRDVNTTK